MENSDTQEVTIFSGKIVITPLLKAQKTFEEALLEAHSQLEQDGTIQRFEYTFELLWKTLKRILNYKGMDVNTPRDTFRLAAKENLLEDPEVWFHFLEHRNETVHIYNQEVAQNIFAALASFRDELRKVTEKIKAL